MQVKVYNLGTGEELTYTGLIPREALISAAIYQNGEADKLLNPLTRARYEKQIISGRYGMSIGNLAVKYL